MWQILYECHGHSQEGGVGEISMNMMIFVLEQKNGKYFIRCRTRWGARSKIAEVGRYKPCSEERMGFYSLGSGVGGRVNNKGLLGQGKP